MRVRDSAYSFKRQVIDVELQNGVPAYCTAYPERRSELKRLCLALRRGGVDSMERLSALYRTAPEQLLTIRDIGSERMDLIGRLLLFYHAEAPPG